MKDLKDAYIKNGFEIIVHTPMPTRNISEQVRAEYKRKKYEEKYEEKMKIYRFPMFHEGKNTFIRAFRYILCNIDSVLERLPFKGNRCHNERQHASYARSVMFSRQEKVKSPIYL